MEAPPRYTEQPRWGGRSPLRDEGVTASHQEVDGSEDGGSNGQDWPASTYESSGESITPRDNVTHDIIMGQDPTELSALTFPSLVKSESQTTNPEMQEKRGIPSIISAAMGDLTNKSSATDSMDIDELSIDEPHAGTQVPLANPEVE